MISGEAARVPRLESVQMLRGVAAMLVVVHHAALFLVFAHDYDVGTPYLVPSEAVALMGAIGVDLFFVISGFVMALSARRFIGGRGAAVFLLQRCIRIVPLFYLACLLMLANMLRAGLPVDPESVLNSLTFIPIFDDETYSWPLHFLGWTLAFEFIFYLVVATLITLGHGGRHAMLLAAVVSIPFLGFVVQAQPIAWKMVTNPILWEFGLGVIACILWEKRLLGQLRLPFGAGLGVALIAAAIALWGWPERLTALGEDTIPGTRSAARALYWGVPTFFFFCLVIAQARTGEGPMTRLMKILGDASYSIYLSHLAAIGLMRKVLERQPLQADLVIVMTAILAALVGIAVYRLVEKPMLTLGQRSIRQWSTRYSVAR